MRYLLALTLFTMALGCSENKKTEEQRTQVQVEDGNAKLQRMAGIEAELKASGIDLDSSVTAVPEDLSASQATEARTKLTEYIKLGGEVEQVLNNGNIYFRTGSRYQFDQRLAAAKRFQALLADYSGPRARPAPAAPRVSLSQENQVLSAQIDETISAVLKVNSETGIDLSEEGFNVHAIDTLPAHKKAALPALAADVVSKVDAALATLGRMENHPDIQAAGIRAGILIASLNKQRSTILPLKINAEVAKQRAEMQPLRRQFLPRNGAFELNVSGI